MRALTILKVFKIQENQKTRLHHIGSSYPIHASKHLETIREMSPNKMKSYVSDTVQDRVGAHSHLTAEVFQGSALGPYSQH